MGNISLSDLYMLPGKYIFANQADKLAKYDQAYYYDYLLLFIFTHIIKSYVS